MDDALRSPERRRWLRLMATLPAAGWALPALAVPPAPPAAPPQATATQLPEGATMLVAGPDGGLLDQWSRVLRPALGQAAALPNALRQVNVGAADGVTGANQFEARTQPDGTTLLLAPGDAALAWLAGDPRAKFDVGQWMSVMAAMSPAILVGRPGRLGPADPIRIASAPPFLPDLPALMGLELLGAAPVLVAETAESDALAQGRVDAVLLRGTNVRSQLRAVMDAGAQPWCSFGVADEAGRIARDPDFPAIPSFAELYQSLRAAPAAGAMLQALSALTAATQLTFGLVLPQLTPAAIVALWRRAGAESTDALGVQAMCGAFGVRTLASGAAASCIAALTAPQPVLLALRKWVADRSARRPS